MLEMILPAADQDGLTRGPVAGDRRERRRRRAQLGRRDLRHRGQPDGGEALRRSGRPDRRAIPRPPRRYTTPPVRLQAPIIDQGYYQTYNRDNVTLVDLRKGPIRAVTPTGIDTEQGIHELDVIIYATGFDAMTGALSRIDIRGRDGMSLRDAGSEGPMTYLGLAVAGFPNLFIVQAPGSPSAATQFRRGAGATRRMDRRLHRASARHGYRTIDAQPEAQRSGSST